MKGMRSVTIRSRADGVTELAPRLAPLHPGDRLMVIVTVLLVTGGLFVCGYLPAGVAAAFVVACIAGELVLALKAGVLFVLRPAAQVHEVPRFARRRG